MRIVCIKLCEVIDVYNIGISHALFLLVRYRSIVDRYLLMIKLNVSKRCDYFVLMYVYLLSSVAP